MSLPFSLPVHFETWFCLYSLGIRQGLKIHSDRLVIMLYLASVSEKEKIVLQWAEVLSADAFSAFEDAGLNDSKVLIVSCNFTFSTQ